MPSMLEEIGVVAPDLIDSLRMTLRLVAAAALGALVGFERERRGRAAGLRTHMLVALGAALFTAVVSQAEGSNVDLANVAKGIAAGVGFLGAGSILKRAQQKSIEGLTTAANIWLTAAVGFSVGAGWFFPAIVGTLLAFATLFPISLLEKHAIEPEKDGDS